MRPLTLVLWTYLFSSWGNELQTEFVPGQTVDNYSTMYPKAIFKSLRIIIVLAGKSSCGKDVSGFSFNKLDALLQEDCREGEVIIF